MTWARLHKGFFIKTYMMQVLASLFLMTMFTWADNTATKVIIQKSNIVTKTIGVKGMTCVGYEVTLEKSIKKIHGVVASNASTSAKNAVISYDKTKTDEATVTEIIKNTGYTPFNIVDLMMKQT